MSVIENLPPCNAELRYAIYRRCAAWDYRFLTYWLPPARWKRQILVYRRGDGAGETAVENPVSTRALQVSGAIAAFRKRCRYPPPMLKKVSILWRWNRRVTGISGESVL